MADQKIVRFGHDLEGVNRCPHCSVANPQLVRMWHSGDPFPRNTEGKTSVWAIYRCTSCGGGLIAKGKPGEHTSNPEIVEVFPPAKDADINLPDTARRFLQQAYETLHAPDAAVVMAGSAVDAMLKDVGYGEGSLYTRIDKAVQEHVLTEGMGDWAHVVRLGSNRPRHADKDNPHVSQDEAKQAVEFAEALGMFLFVLTAKISKGLEAAGGEGGT